MPVDVPQFDPSVLLSLLLSSSSHSKRSSVSSVSHDSHNSAGDAGSTMALNASAMSVASWACSAIAAIARPVPTRATPMSLLSLLVCPSVFCAPCQSKWCPPGQRLPFDRVKRHVGGSFTGHRLRSFWLCSPKHHQHFFTAPSGCRVLSWVFDSSAFLYGAAVDARCTRL